MKKKFALGLLCLLVFGSVVFTIGCGQAQVAAQIGKISGRILAADGATPIVGATVSLKTDTSKSATTDSTGSFTLEGTWIVTGTYTLVAEKGSFKLEFSVTVAGEGETTQIGSKEVDPTVPGATIPDLGVIKGCYDKIENIITALGYSYRTLEADDLDNYAYISTFEAIFINCGYYSQIVGSGSKEANLLKFVTEEGKSLYTSDWAGDVVEAIWPKAVNWYGGTVKSAGVGSVQTLVATVVDNTLQTLLGKTTAEVYYNLGAWVVISSEGIGTDVLLKGNPAIYAYSGGAAGIRSASPVTIASVTTLESVPLAVKFQPGGSSKGTVIYTTFHNEAQEEEVTADARKILQDFIFRL